MWRLIWKAFYPGIWWAGEKKSCRCWGGAMPGDLDTIRVFGHRMKGTGGAYGLDAITEIGNTLEQAAIHQSINEIEELLDSFLNYLDRLEVVYV